MADQTAKLSPAASRKWFIYAAVVGTFAIGATLLYRGLSGNTVKAQRAAQEAAKDAKELANKPPGNPESFSAKLAQRSRETAEALAKSAANAIENAAVPPPATTSASAASAPANASGTVPSAAVRRAGDPGQGLPRGTPARPGEPSDEQLDAYAVAKQADARNANRKLASWEAPDRLGLGVGATRSNVGNNAAGSPEMLLAALGTADPQSTAAPGAGNVAPAGSTAAALLDTYLKSQSLAQAAAGASSASRDDQFLQRAGRKGIEAPLYAQPGLGRYSVIEGTSVPLVMRTAVSSDIAGPCRAQVLEDVYDTVTGSMRLIPAGATALCVYNSEVVQGQERLLIAFTRLIYPNGASVALAGSAPGTDAQGVAGAPAEVNSRFFKTFGTSFLVAALSKLAESRNQGSGVTINVSGTLSGAATQVLSDIAKKSLEQNISIKPELRLAAGERLNVVVTRDMVLDPAITGVRQ